MMAVAYHFRPDPMPYFRDQTIIRYPREDVIHIHTKKRPQQIRSMSDMTVCSERVRNLQEYVTNELEASRNAAAVTALVSPTAGNPGIGRRNNTPSGKVIEKIQRGQINYIDGNPLFPAPGRPNVNASGFVSFLLRMIAWRAVFHTKRSPETSHRLIIRRSEAVSWRTARPSAAGRRR